MLRRIGPIMCASAWLRDGDDVEFHNTLKREVLPARLNTYDKFR